MSDPRSSAQAQCPWCLATLDGKEIRAALPPALVLIGDRELVSASAGIAAAGGSSGFSPFKSSEPAMLEPSQMDTVEESEPLNFSDEISELADEDLEASDRDMTFVEDDLEPIGPETDSEMDAGEADSEGGFRDTRDFGAVNEEHVVATEAADEDDLSEFMISDGAGKSELDGEAASHRSAPMMDVTPGKRRRSSGSPIKTILGVAAGLPLGAAVVVGLLYLLGRPVPILGDYFPALNGTPTAMQASAPNPVGNADPGPMIERPPVTGRSLADEMTETELMAVATDPADAALSELTGDAALPDPTLPDPTVPDPTSMPEVSGDESLFNPDEVRQLSDPPAVAEIPADEPGKLDPRNAGPEMAPFDPSSAETLPAAEATPTDLFGPTESTDPTATQTKEDSTPSGMTLPSAVSERTAESLEVTPGSEPPAAEPPAEKPPAAAGFDADARVAGINRSLDDVFAADAADGSRENAIRTFHESIAAYVAEAPPAAINRLQPVLAKVASDMSVVVALAKTTPQWITGAADERSSDGTMIVGKLSGEVGEAKLLLVNKRNIPVTLPPSIDSVPVEIQIGVGRIEGDGDDVRVVLDLMQSL